MLDNQDCPYSPTDRVISTIHMIRIPAEADDPLHNPGLYNLAPTRPGKITAGQANKVDYVLK